MNRKEHLLTILMEECSELQQAAAKALRFGKDSDYTGCTNEKQMHKEYNDILGAVELLYKEGYNLYDDNDLVEAKQAKVEKYLLESKELGTLNE